LEKVAWKVDSRDVKRKEEGGKHQEGIGRGEVWGGHGEGLGTRD
jgi:hypothetical protein